MSGFLRPLGALAAVSAAVAGLAFVLISHVPAGGLKMTRWLGDPTRIFGLILPILWIVALAGTTGILRPVSRHASATVLLLIGVLLTHILLSAWRSEVFPSDFLHNAPFLSNAHLGLYVFGSVAAIYWATFSVRVAGPASTIWMAAGLLVIITATIVLAVCALFAFSGRTGGGRGWISASLTVLLGLSVVHCLALACLASAMIRSATPPLPTQRRRTYA